MYVNDTEEIGVWKDWREFEREAGAWAEFIPSGERPRMHIDVKEPAPVGNIFD